MAGEGAFLLPLRGVPDLAGAVFGDSREESTIRGESDATHEARVTAQALLQDPLAIFLLPDSRNAIRPPGSKALAIRRHGDGAHAAAMLVNHGRFLAGGEVPDADAGVGADRHERVAIGKERDAERPVGVPAEGMQFVEG